jgi:signal transduction histidine kinase
LRIFGLDMEVTYSTDKQDLGKEDLAQPSILAASSGNDDPIFDIDAAMPYWKAFLSLSLEPRSFILRTSYPLRIENRLSSSGAESPLMGVLEFTRDITTDMENAIRFQQLILAVTLGSSSVMVVLLIFFIRRAERVISARIAAEQRLQLELLQHEKLAGMGRVIASIAHEIRNPLGIIRSSAELLLKRAATFQDKGTSRIIQAIFDEARRLSQTITDFLDYARPHPPKQAHVDVSAIIAHVMAFLEPELAKRHIHVERRGLAENSPAIMGDTDLLYRAFYNVMSNALQAMDDNGGLTIELVVQDEPNPEVRIVFHDSGPGFPTDTLTHILDPFFTTKDDGTGLGLPIVNSIVTSHGGSLAFENHPDGGALVTISLPTRQPE